MQSFLFDKRVTFLMLGIGAAKQAALFRSFFEVRATRNCAVALVKCLRFCFYRF
jgi:hypothetical protein|tara:strand:+ start:580 stop:741 length:162 start_codon:yes stop_codon:yes gene_type:complete